jgi:hypothetical protein
MPTLLTATLPRLQPLKLWARDQRCRREAPGGSETLEELVLENTARPASPK